MDSKIYSGIIILILLLVVVAPSYAHTGNSPRDNFMRQMMVDNAFETMEEMEEQMMGSVDHERMGELMDKLLTGTLSSIEQNEMIGLMRNGAAGPGAMNMMMRMMTSQMMMRNWGLGMMGWSGGFTALGILGTLTWLVWFTVGILLIVWLWQKIAKK